MGPAVEPEGDTGLRSEVGSVQKKIPPDL